jgi:formylglycine-generating enzyme required for sulfatase activity
LDACVTVPAGTYLLGDGGERRYVLARPISLGRFPLTNAHAAAFAQATGRVTDAEALRRIAAATLADHPATGMTFDDALAFCDWASEQLGRHVRLPSGDEWEAAARGPSATTWPWGDAFDAERCNGADAGWGWTVPVTAHPGGASACGAEQLAGNVWEWVADEPDADGWRVVRGGSYFDTGWGLRAARSLPADPDRATPTTGLRIVIEDQGGAT